jgi:hypothetical protein
MTPDRVLSLAEPLLRPVLGEDNVETIEVREDDDWSGAPSIYIDVFVAPGTKWPDGRVLTGLRRTLSDKLVAAGEARFPYIRLRDRKEENDDMPGQAA